MQTVAAYLLEHSAQQIEHTRERFDLVSKTIREWLKEKRVANPNEDIGKFVSKTDGIEGGYKRILLEAHSGLLEETYLSEPTFGGQIFTTRISVLQAKEFCAIYCTLSVQNTKTIIAPFLVNPRCPSVVRKLISTFPDWALSGDPIESPTINKFSGADEAELLITEILREDRRLPVVVISELEGEPVWPEITKALAFDLACLAKVFQIDEEASWEFTKGLGKLHSCYMGAIRLYWPPRNASTKGGVPPTTVWTASLLMSDDFDGAGRDRFCALMRRTIMNVAALTIEPPQGIREIHSSSQRKRLEELEAKATEKSQELEIAKSYLEDNENLQDEVSRLQTEVTILVARAEAAEFKLSQGKQDTGVFDGSSASEDDDSPQEGQVRFYKKTHSKPGYDVMVQIKDCGHSSWQDASKGDKAKKGIERLEGRGDWVKINHCGSCTGGGMWRVKW